MCSRSTYPGHPSIDNKVRPVHEATLIASQEKYCLSLFDGLSEPAGGEVNLSTMPFSLIVP